MNQQTSAKRKAYHHGNLRNTLIVAAAELIEERGSTDFTMIEAARRAEAMVPFARLDEARNQDKGSGVGLGLAIARDIAQRHGGSLSLGDSAALGGLRVDLVLPR